MNKTVVALYDDFTSANHAVRELVDRGFPREDISLVSPDQVRDGEYSVDTDIPGEQTADMGGGGAAVGAGVGAAVGGISGLLIGVGSLFIPGVGLVLAAGPLISMLASAGVGAAVGGVTGGLLGALVALDIPEEHAQGYAEGVRRGGSLVTVRTTEDRADQVVEILNWHKPVNIDQRVSEWREAGWTGSPSHDTPATSEDADWPHHESREVAYQDDYDLSDDLDTEMDEEDDEDEYISETASEKQDFDYYEPVFRNHFEIVCNRSNASYDEFRPAYYYGYTLALDNQYQGRDWDDLEPVAQQYWEDREPGTWDRFKETVREAWEDIKEAVS